MSVSALSFDAVIFDMDGLMLDTEPLYKIAWQQAAAECGHPISEELYTDLIGRSRVAGEAILANAFGADFRVEEFRAACGRSEAAAFAENLPAIKPGLEEVLALLEARAIPKAIATSTERHIAELQLRGLGLLARFDVVATGDEVVNGKPAPDLFLLAASRLGVDASRCLALEDSEAGVMAAHRAGMRVYCVPDIKVPSPDVLRLADGVFESLYEVALLN
jgi:HAD superfamily hydrolase (TIGR01509 family)